MSSSFLDFGGIGGLQSSRPETSFWSARMTENPSRNAMTKADLINIVARKLDITQVQSGIIVEAALKSVVNALQNGQEVEIRGFGSFRFRNRAPRKGRNPKTGEKVDVPPKKIPYFKMGKELKALLNGAAAEDAAPAAPEQTPGS
jgi:integration host factor subunit beta